MGNSLSKAMPGLTSSYPWFTLTGAGDWKENQMGAILAVEGAPYLGIFHKGRFHPFTAPLHLWSDIMEL